MADKPIVSLCIPTNGVVEWVFPVLDSIFSQNVDSDLFEVVLTDNGNNGEFKAILKEQYLGRYANLVYAETQAPLFLNEIEAYKRAGGTLIKFVNHRTLLLPGAVEELVEFAREYEAEKPIVYFSNGVLPELEKKRYFYENFDGFVNGLTYFSSWSTGMTFWKTDFDSIPEGTVFNELFPHTTILFRERHRKQYIIDNTQIMNELPVGKLAKGRYDLFYAFAVEYLGLLLDLLRNKDITAKTFLRVKEENLEFLSSLYLDHVLRKKPCSYDLSGFDSSIDVFYSRMQIWKYIPSLLIQQVTYKIQMICFRK